MTRANLTIVASLRYRFKEICVRICTSGEASVLHRKLSFFAFPELAAFTNNRSALEHAEFVESVLKMLV